MQLISGLDIRKGTNLKWPALYTICRPCNTPEKPKRGPSHLWVLAEPHKSGARIFVLRETKMSYLYNDKIGKAKNASISTSKFPFSVGGRNLFLLMGMG